VTGSDGDEAREVTDVRFLICDFGLPAIGGSTELPLRRVLENRRTPILDCCKYLVRRDRVEWKIGEFADFDDSGTEPLTAGNGENREPRSRAGTARLDFGATSTVRLAWFVKAPGISIRFYSV
jgi:hypothetical protein